MVDSHASNLEYTHGHKMVCLWYHHKVVHIGWTRIICLVTYLIKLFFFIFWMGI